MNGEYMDNKTFDTNVFEIFKNIPVAFAVFDTNMNYITYSNQWVEDYGLNEDYDLTDKNHYDVFPEIPQHWRDLHQRCLKGEHLFNKSEKFVRDDGSVQYDSWDIRPWYTNDKKIGGMIATTKNVTSKVVLSDTKNKLKEAINFLNSAQKIAKLGSWSLDIVKNELVWSDEIYNIFELDKNKFEASYDGFLNAIHPDDREAVNEAYRSSLEDKMPYSVTHRLLMRDGSIKWVREECKTEFDNDGNPLLSAGTVQDITKDIEHENKIKEQEKIIQNQTKIAAVGEMLSNISHQWRQPLNIITMDASNIMAEYELEGNVSKDLVVNTMHSVQKQAKYLSKTIDDFRNFFMEDSNICKSVNIKESLEKIDDLVKYSLKNNYITIIKEFEDVYVELNENKLTQVIINIFNNAKDAIVKNNVDTDERVVCITLTKDEQNAIIRIKDSGGGIKKDIIDKIFEPYFTTKNKSIGTGIGLYMSHQIITKHFHGTIDVTNTSFTYNGKELKGAEFIITIPFS